jgi:LacI family transcriptional regulator
MVKIADVAREAGVSAATVSRVLNGLPTGPEYAERVRAAAERLDYRPNGIARSLRRQTTDVIGLIISSLTSPFFAEVTRGVEDTAQRNGYSVLLCISDEEPKREARNLRVLEQQQIAGLVITPHSARTDVSRFRAARIPLVVVDRPLGGRDDSVTVDSVEGAMAATGHLLAAGWQRPACITGPGDASTARDRLAGYRRALADGSVDKEWVATARYSESGGAAAAAELLDRRDPPDAFFVAGGNLAIGVLEEVTRRGLVFGRDLGMVTFDDAPWAPFVSPPMSVVAQPTYDIGVKAAELLLARLRGERTRVRHEVLSTTLIVRESSKRGSRPARSAGSAKNRTARSS